MRGLSSCGSRALECRLSSGGAQASLLRGLWNLPGPGLEPVSPVLAGGFLTTAPPGKSEEGPLKAAHSIFSELFRVVKIFFCVCVCVVV